MGGETEESVADKSLSAEVEARLTRRVYLLLGLVPLPDMTQAETDWVFRQRVRFAAGD